MRLLLDTHTFLWTVENSDRLSARARAAIADVGNEKLLSIASLWEIAIKVSLGRLAIAAPFDEMVDRLVANRLITLLPITPAHLKRVATLPHHTAIHSTGSSSHRRKMPNSLWSAMIQHSMTMARFVFGERIAGNSRRHLSETSPAATRSESQR